MNGWNAKDFLRKLRRRKIKTWYLIVLLAISLIASVFFLRQNNLEMLRLRREIIIADEKNGDVAGSIKALNSHVFSHMNTEIVRPVELVHTYNRQAEEAIKLASKDSKRPNIYAEAMRRCEATGEWLLSNIAKCASDYIMKNRPEDLIKEIKLPEKDRFIYTFAAPLWTADAAGFSLAISGVVLLWLIGRGLIYLVAVLVIRHRSRQSF